jgi:betaine-aldehyde dehydrogenase
MPARQAYDQGPWPQMPSKERGRLLRDVAEAIRQDIEELSRLEVLESGKPISQARGEMETAADLWDYATTLARHVYGDTYNGLGRSKIGFVFREPIGVVGMITPWNFPLLIASQKLPFALAAGCTAVVKPSELTPGTTLRLADVLLEAGLPEGVVNVVTGYGEPAGARLGEHPGVDMISFTGSTEVGKRIVASSADTLKKVELELGGKNPQIVFADADLEAALDAVVFGTYFNMGECCNSGSRLLVQEEIAGEFVEAVVERSRNVPVGDPLEEDTKIGAIINEEQLDKIVHYVDEGQREGARLRLGGERLSTKQGRFVEPTVFDDVEPSMQIAQEEIFGPVLSALTFDTAEEAIQIANDTMYGLSAGVWTQDVDRAFQVSRGVRAGTVWINCFMDGHAELPFGGYKESGLGRELGRFSVDEFNELKTVQLHLGDRENWWLDQSE